MEELDSPKTRAHQVKLVLDTVFTELSRGGVKASVADFIRLIQVSGELTPDDDFDQVTVEWLETIEIQLADE